MNDLKKNKQNDANSKLFIVKQGWAGLTLIGELEVDVYTL